MTDANIMRPEKRTAHIGSVADLRAFLNDLPEEVDGLEEMYEINTYHISDTNERWLEITPTK